MSLQDRIPHIPEMLLGMMSGIDQTLVLPDQFIDRIFRNLAKFLVRIRDHAPVVGDRDEHMLISRLLDKSCLHECVMKRRFLTWYVVLHGRPDAEKWFTIRITGSPLGIQSQVITILIV